MDRVLTFVVQAVEDDSAECCAAVKIAGEKEIRSSTEGREGEMSDMLACSVSLFVAAF